VRATGKLDCLQYGKVTVEWSGAMKATGKLDCLQYGKATAEWSGESNRKTGLSAVR
jgi:hypothetical protein